MGHAVDIVNSAENDSFGPIMRTQHQFLVASSMN